MHSERLAQLQGLDAYESASGGVEASEDSNLAQASTMAIRASRGQSVTSSAVGPSYGASGYRGSTGQQQSGAYSGNYSGAYDYRGREGSQRDQREQPKPTCCSVM